jgi:hypothetical protein
MIMRQTWHLLRSDTTSFLRHKYSNLMAEKAKSRGPVIDNAIEAESSI